MTEPFFEAAHTELEAETRTPSAPVEQVGGKPYMRSTKGHLVPVESISPVDLLMDEMVRKIHGYAEALSAQVARFKQHTADDIYGFMALLAQEYDIVRGGPKGNVTFQSFDGLLRVSVQTAERVTFGPELQAAKALVDACLLDWSAESGAELRTIVQNAFNVDKQGDVSPARMFSLLRYRIEDERWKRAMKAVTDSIRPIGTKEYFRFHRRESASAPWQLVTIDLAAA